MIEDKLTRDERIRLECLAQANVSLGQLMPQSLVLVIDRAKAFEEYIRGEEEDNASTG